jgi:hypothetical protein
MVSSSPTGSPYEDTQRAPLITLAYPVPPWTRGRGEP